jgi:uncharacterized protein YneF (UPF0154 family)
MKDTPPEIEEKVREIFRKKTPEERIRMGCEMYDVSRYLVRQALLRENPHISEAELKQQLFLRFYGNEFSKDKMAEILAHLAKHT